MTLPPLMKMADQLLSADDRLLLDEMDAHAENNLVVVAPTLVDGRWIVRSSALDVMHLDTLDFATEAEAVEAYKEKLRAQFTPVAAS